MFYICLIAFQDQNEHIKSALTLLSKVTDLDSLQSNVFEQLTKENVNDKIQLRAVKSNMNTYDIQEIDNQEVDLSFFLD